MTKDFDSFVGTGAKVYLNIGSEKGVKPGDVYRALRGYTAAETDEVDRLSFKAYTTEDTQKNQVQPSKDLLKALPRRALGEMVVLSATPTSSTAMITFALEDIHVGDAVAVAEAAGPK
jgi:hypothetical protein